MGNSVQTITPNLWFDSKAEEAARFYTSVFPNSGIGRITHYGKAHAVLGVAEGGVMTVEFQLDGQPFVALNGGPHFQFTEAISFIVHCRTQEEVDYYWEKLAEGGDEKAQVCGWLRDKFGVSWQVVPAELSAMVSDPDPDKAERTMTAMLGMKKMDIAGLKRAYEG